jgi:GPI-anchor transamidase subunit T
MAIPGVSETATVLGSSCKPDSRPSDDLVSDISYVPAEPHSRPTKFQSTITLPANSTVELRITVIKSFLRYTEHPPDAHRGWDLPPAVFVPFASIEGRTNGTSSDRIYDTFPDSRLRMYTPILLVDLATPDFSMPYNVIIFSCSLMAFIFGSVFNLLTRKFVVVSLSEEKK